MAVNTKPTVIFLHVPKAAGTSLRMVLRWQYRASGAYCVDGNVLEAKARLMAMSVETRASLRAIWGHVAFGWHELIPLTLCIRKGMSRPLLKFGGGSGEILRDVRL